MSESLQDDFSNSDTSKWSVVRPATLDGGRLTLAEQGDLKCPFCGEEFPNIAPGSTVHHDCPAMKEQT
jgi:hypothetical protein